MLARDALRSRCNSLMMESRLPMTVFAVSGAVPHTRFSALARLGVFTYIAARS
jgi:hypothetical protein